MVYQRIPMLPLQSGTFHSGYADLTQYQISFHPLLAGPACRDCEITFMYKTGVPHRLAYTASMLSLISVLYRYPSEILVALSRVSKLKP